MKLITGNIIQYVNSFIPEFDRDYWAEYTANKLNLTKEEVLLDWKLARIKHEQYFSNTLKDNYRVEYKNIYADCHLNDNTVIYHTKQILKTNSNEYLLPPYTHLPNCNFIKYSLYLNYIKLLFKLNNQEVNLKLIGRNLEVTPPDLINYEEYYTRLG